MTTDPRVLELLRATKKIGGYLMTARKINQPEWLAGIDELIAEADAAIASVESGEDWIEIKEGCEMPKEGLDVRVINENMMQSVGSFNPSCTCSKKWHVTGTPTYWKPLDWPTPPSTEAAKGEN